MENYQDIYDIEMKPQIGRIIVTVKGYFTAESHEHFKNNVTAAVKKMATDGKRVDLLFDLMAAMTQSQEVAKDNAYMFELANHINRVGTALNSVLYKMQIQRLSLGDKVQFFESFEDAEKWLDNEG